MTERPLTGAHVFAIFAGAFAIIIAVNITLAVKAVDTFPGLEVPNSYVASQTFDARKRAQTSLGWTVAAGVEQGHLRIAISDTAGRPVAPASLSVLVGRPTEASDDVQPALAFDGAAYSAPVDLGSGLWTIMLKATSDTGTAFEKRFTVAVP